MLPVCLDTQAHEPNIVHGKTTDGQYILLGTMNAHNVAPPAGIINCSNIDKDKRGHMASFKPLHGMDPLPPPKDTYAWIASSPDAMANAKPVLVVNSTRWDADPNVHHTTRTAVSSYVAAQFYETSAVRLVLVVFVQLHG